MVGPGGRLAWGGERSASGHGRGGAAVHTWLMAAALVASSLGAALPLGVMVATEALVGVIS